MNRLPERSVAGTDKPSTRSNPRGALAASSLGPLDLTALSRMHFYTLSHEQQAQAIRRLAATGMSDYGMSHATGLAVEQIRRVLAEQVPV